jgi:hypothetical protein
MVTQAMCLFLSIVFTAISFIIAPDADSMVRALLVGPILGVFAGIVLAVPGWLAFGEAPRRPASGLRWAPNWPGAAIAVATTVLLVAPAGLPLASAATVGLGLCIAFGLGVTSVDTAVAGSQVSPGLPPPHSSQPHGIPRRRSPASGVCCGKLERFTSFGTLTCNVISSGLGMVADRSLTRVGAEQERNHFAGPW